MEKIAIVTDSSCDASDAELAEMGVVCVHLNVQKADGTPFPEDNSSENIEAFYDYISECKDLPSTSCPPPTAFSQVYSKLADEGFTHIISLHMPHAMSATVDVAGIAAKESPLPVDVIDTQCNTVGQYLFVRRVAQLRNAGATRAELLEAIEELIGKTSVCFMLDTLKCLVKGGRTGKAVGLAATLLNIKPLLTVDPTGEVDMFGKTKSVKRAASKLADHYLKLQDKFGPLECCFVHTRNLPGVNLLREALLERNVDLLEVGVRQAGPVITTHVCTGCFGFAYIPRATV